MDVLTRLDEVRAEIDVLDHPFYTRWSAGELSPEELACYAGEYRHAVVALARASALAAEKARPPHVEGLRRHAQEEAEHVAMWDGFATATAAAVAAAPGSGPAGHSAGEAGCLPETAECIAAWGAGEDLLEHLAVLYAIEAGQPEISRTKLDGLEAHYGYREEGPATEYFAVHELRDVDHAREAARLIAELMAGVPDEQEQGERMLSRARAALRGNWRLLDGLQA